MNFMRTAMLLAAMTAIFMGVGYLVGGAGGMIIAFLIAAGMNLFAYWNADKMVLRMNGAREVDARTAPEFYAHRPGPRAEGRPADAARLRHRQSPAERLCHRPQSGERRRRRDHRALALAVARGDRRGDGARARPREEPRHADS